MEAFGDAGDAGDVAGSSGGEAGGDEGQFGDETTENMEVTAAISAKAGEGGLIEPSGAIDAEINSEVTFTITPDEGYEVADLLVDGESKGAVSSYTMDVGKDNHKITATFRRI